jgi:hypothetical protein
MFIEVDSVEKQCTVIINLDHIIEIAPLKAGGCTLFYADSAAVNGKTAYQVANNFEHFRQFALQTVSSEDIAKRFPSRKGESAKVAKEYEVPKL